MINIGVSSAAILSPLKVVDPSSLHLYKTGLPNELDYILGNSGLQNVDDTKDHRSQMTSSFIKLGRNQVESDMKNSDYSASIDLEPKSRISRDKSDIIIKFARSGLRGAVDFGPARNFRFLPVDVQQLFALCSDFNNINPDDTGLVQLCNSIMQSNEDSKNN